jgi:hypothetical protein
MFLEFVTWFFENVSSIRPADRAKNLPQIIISYIYVRRVLNSLPCIITDQLYDTIINEPLAFKRMV